MAKTFKLVLLRHGESEWNKANLFTGWVDVDLTAKGRDEAVQAGELLKSEGYDFDYVYTSVLKRAIRTQLLALEQMDRMWLPVERDWRLNERHYGSLQGLNKAQTTEKYGESQVFIWRRSYDTPPPPLADDSDMLPAKDPKYRNIEPKLLPKAEALLHTKNRFMPYWEKNIAPRILRGERVLIVAHGNSLRALIKHLDQISDDEITELNIPTGIPLVYELDDKLKPLKNYYLGDAEAAAKAAQAVANQAKKS